MNDRELHQNSDLKGSNATSQGKFVAPRGSDKANSPVFNDIQSILGYLDKLDPKTKVRVIFKDYGLWREFLPLSETYKNKFFKFVEKKDFLISANIQKPQSKETSSLKDSLIKFLDSNKVNEEIKQVLLGEL